MKEKIKQWAKKPWVIFVAKTLFYFVILMILVYLYSYRGVGNSHFIYNEF